MLLPTKRNYWIETNYQQYVHAHHSEDLDETRKIIEEKYPEYIPFYDKSMKQTTGHRFNMFIMKKELADAYCTWLFDILFELEKGWIYRRILPMISVFSGLFQKDYLISGLIKMA